MGQAVTAYLALYLSALLGMMALMVGLLVWRDWRRARWAPLQGALPSSEPLPTLVVPSPSPATPAADGVAPGDTHGRRKNLSVWAVVAASLLVVLVGFGAVVARAQTIGLEWTTARLIATIHRQSVPDPALVAELALRRQQEGRLQEAADTWGILVKQRALSSWSSPPRPVGDWGEVARFQLRRLQRAQNLRRHPPDAASLRPQIKAALLTARPALRQVLAQRGGGHLLVVQAIDLDGDAFPEVFGFARPNRSVYWALLVLKWNPGAKQWGLQWNALSADYCFRTEPGLQGMGEIVVSAVDGGPETGRILSNGERVIWLTRVTPPSPNLPF